MDNAYKNFLDAAPPSAEFVYVLTSTYSPQLVKIGRTRKTPNDRVREINGQTGMANDHWQLAYVVITTDSHELEARLHRRFKAHAKGGEVFLIPYVEVVKVLAKYPVIAAYDVARKKLSDGRAELERRERARTEAEREYAKSVNDPVQVRRYCASIPGWTPPGWDKKLYSASPDEVKSGLPPYYVNIPGVGRLNAASRSDALFLLDIAKGNLATHGTVVRNYNGYQNEEPYIVHAPPAAAQFLIGFNDPRILVSRHADGTCVYKSDLVSKSPWWRRWREPNK